MHSLQLNIEPIFATLALYDVKSKRKVSENFHFDMNNDDLRRMLESYNDKVDESTKARACIFDISQSTSPTDLFLVVKLEKVLQGDINDAAEPYLKDMASQPIQFIPYFRLIFCAHRFCPKRKMFTFSQAHSDASTNGM